MKILTDCKALSWLLHLNVPTGKFARMQAYIKRYNYTIEHRPGHQMQHVDCLSRETYDDDSVEWYSLFTLIRS